MQIFKQRLKKKHSQSTDEETVNSNMTTVIMEAVEKEEKKMVAEKETFQNYHLVF